MARQTFKSLAAFTPQYSKSVCDHISILCVKGLGNMKWFHNKKIILVDIYLFKVNNGNTRTMSEICSKLTIKTLEWRQWLMWFLNLLFAGGLSLAIRQQCGKISVQSQQQRYWNNFHRHVFINDFENAFFYRVMSHGLWYFSVKINPFMHVGKWPDRLLKVLQRSHHNILKVSVTIFQYYAWKG